jgi:RNA polymerase sigma-70 factor (sigma-E family)
MDGQVRSLDDDFTEFAGARWLSLVRAAMALGSSLADAEDLAQTTLTRAYASWGKVVKAQNRDAYVSKMLVNAHRDAHRKRWMRETPVAEIPEAAESSTAPEVERADAIRRAVRSLNQGQREVLALRFYVRLTEAEIADVLNIAPGTVKSRLSRALARLAVDPNLTQNGESR